MTSDLNELNEKHQVESDILQEHELDDKIDKLKKEIKDKESEMNKFKKDLNEVDDRIKGKREELELFDKQEKEIIESRRAKMVDIAMQTEYDNQLTI